MLVNSADEFLAAPNKAITLFGMSGVGKTTVANKLPKSQWFHYSIDYRIGTRYLNEEINDMLKAMALRDPDLAPLLKSDSIFLGSNLTVDNLAPLSTYVGILGNAIQGGLDYEEYLRRQDLHRQGEIQSLLDISLFKSKGQKLYGYPHFLADTGGSLIEVIDLDDPEDPVVKAITRETLLVYIEAGEELMAEVIRRGIADPKPMYLCPRLLQQTIDDYIAKTGNEDVNRFPPKDYAAFALESIMQDRAPRYRALAAKHGYIVTADEVASLKSEQDFLNLVSTAIERRA